MTLFAALTLLPLTHAALAQTPAAAPRPDLTVEGPAMQQLRSAAAGDAASTMDGSVPRRDGPYEIIEERRDQLLDTRRVPAHRDCDYTDAGGYDDGSGRPHGMRPHRNCVNVPAHTEREYGDIQKVRVADRKALVRKRTWIGAGIGAAVGALGFLALLAGPVGWFVGIAGIVAGAGIGAAIGSETARKTPDTFDRTVNERTESSSR